MENVTTPKGRNMTPTITVIALVILLCVVTFMMYNLGLENKRIGDALQIDNYVARTLERTLYECKRNNKGVECELSVVATPSIGERINTEKCPVAVGKAVMLTRCGVSS